MSQRRCYAALGEKKWGGLFSENPPFEERLQSSIVRVQDGSEIRIYRPHDADTPEISELVEDLEQFNADSCTDIQSKRRAWLDDRSRGGRGVRKYTLPFSASALSEQLAERRLNHPEKADAERRLIYLENVDAEYAKALFESVPLRERSVIAAAIRDHIAFETSIKVEIDRRTNGLRTFVLALQLPYFSFVSLPENFSGGQFWKDVSFLQAPSSTSNGPRALCRSHFAFVIHGHSDRRWTAYAFSKNGLGSLEGGDYGYADFHEDPIALGKLNANSPIYDAREYFVRILEVWIGQISELCKKVIQRTERQISSYINQSPRTFSSSSETQNNGNEEAKKTYEWTKKAMDLIDWQLLDLEAVVVEVEQFFFVDGHVNYLLDFGHDSASQTSQHYICQHLRSVKEQLKDLSKTHRKLLQLKTACERLSSSLHLRLTVESSEQVKQTNEAAQFNGLNTILTNMLITPFHLAATSFSMPQTVIPFRLSLRSFFISVVIIGLSVALATKGLGVILHWWKGADLWVMMLSFAEFVGLITIRVFNYIPIRRQRGIDEEMADRDEAIQG